MIDILIINTNKKMLKVCGVVLTYNYIGNLNDLKSKHRNTNVVRQCKYSSCIGTGTQRGELYIKHIMKNTVLYVLCTLNTLIKNSSPLF